jgi:hypothetical protein
LDGHLNLVYGEGVKLLVIVSDGHYTGSETQNAKDAIKMCADNGVAVLWITFDYDHYATRYIKGTAGKLVKATGTPSETATLIGQACADALTKIGQRNA